MSDREMTMVERVARAIAKADNRSAAWDLPPEMFMEHARAAIESLREPTEAMLGAVKPEPTHLYSSRSEDYQKQMKAAVAISRLGFESDWRVAIDAALKEPTNV